MPIIRNADVAGNNIINNDVIGTVIALYQIIKSINMKKLIFNLLLTLLMSVPLIGQEYHNVKIFKYLKKYDRDTLVQTSLLNTTISIDTIKKSVRISAPDDKLLIRGIWLKRIGPNQFEFSKKIDWHPLTYVTCHIETQPGKTILYTHYKCHWHRFKYSIVFY